jgi:hypothetical protein
MEAPAETALFMLAGVVLVLALLVTASYLYWRRRLRLPHAPASARCRFRPQRLHLRGTVGDLLQCTVATEGVPGSVFVTYVEEPWVVVSPSSGMFPQSVDILVYAAHAPAPGKHTITIRLLPVEGEANAGVLELVVKLRPPRSLPVRPNL